METLARLRADVGRMVNDLPTHEIEGWQCASDLIQIRAKPPGATPDSRVNPEKET